MTRASFHHRSALLAAPLAAALLAAACGKPPAEPFRTEVISRGPITEVVSATGGVEAIVTVNVGTQVSGTISKLYVDFNSKVKKDQLLAEIDARLFRAALERAEAGYASAKANVEKAEAALADAKRLEQHAQELFDAKLTSRADLDTSTANREQAVAQVSVNKAMVMQAKADRDTAAANLAYTRITSPIDGIVVSRAIDIGVTVAASFQTPTLFTIANDLTKMQILANIDEADVGKVREGMETKFTVDAWPGETFSGRIREVRQAPTTIQNVVTYAAVIDAPNPFLKLRQGMTASVQITTGRREDVLRVPNAALRFKPSNPPPAPEPGKEPKPGEKTLASGGRPDGERGGMRAEGGAAAAPGAALAAEGRPAGAKSAGEGGRGAPEGRSPEGGWRGARGEKGGQRDGAQGADGFVRKVNRPGRVYKLVDGKLVLAQLRLGLGDSQRTELLEGLDEGDVVVVSELGGGGAGGGLNLAGPPRPGGAGGTRRGF